MTLKELLKEKGISAYALQKATGIPESSILNLVNGKSEFANITLKNALAIAYVLDIDVEELFIEIYRKPIAVKDKNIQDFVDFVIDLLAIQEVTVSYEEFESTDYAVCYPTQRVICINPQHDLDDFSLYTIILCELRHQFQYDALNAPLDQRDKYEELDIIDEWSIDISRYTNDRNLNRKSLSFVIDSICFAQWIMSLLFDVDVPDFEKDNPAYLERIEDISLDFTKQEIFKILKENRFSKKFVN